MKSAFFYLGSLSGAMGAGTTLSIVNSHYANSFTLYNKFIVGLPFQITMHPNDVKVCEEVSMQCFTNPEKMFPATIRKHNGKGGFVITQWEFKAIIKENGEPEQ